MLGHRTRAYPGSSGTSFMVSNRAWHEWQKGKMPQMNLLLLSLPLPQGIAQLGSTPFVVSMSRAFSAFPAAPAESLWQQEAACKLPVPTTPVSLPQHPCPPGT